MNATSDSPPELDNMDPSTKRTYEALAAADSPLKRSTLEKRTHHAKATVAASLKTLREADLVIRRYPDGPTPRYELTEK